MMWSLFILLSLTALVEIECLQTNVTEKQASKKGVCIAPEYFQCNDVASLNGVSWWYNWGTYPSNLDHPECDQIPAPGFVPMIWGYWGQDFPALPDYDTVLGFNEPNHADQSNLSPEAAAYAWMELQAAYPDKILVSPSASPPNAEQWFDEFFDICNSIGCRIDYLATHAYSGKAEYDRVYLEGLYQRYGKKIWFTEFALPSTKNLEDEMNYMREILSYLESSEAIWRYSWFVQRWPREGSGNGWYLDKVISLLEEDSSALTELGKYYNEF